VVAAVGAGCEPCVAGAECPPWCGRTAVRQVVEDGDGVQILTLALDPPQARPIAARAPKLPAGTPVVLSAGGKPVAELLPGRHAVEASGGGATWTGEVLVPWGIGAFDVEVPLEPPAKGARAETRVKAEVKAKTGTKAETKVETQVPVVTDDGPKTAAARPVTRGDFARWLSKNPDWHKDAAVRAGHADDSYLQDWDGASPPGGTDAQAVVNVSWYAAAAYCSGKGGLADTTAAPTTWSESAAQPGLEWRTESGKAAWRSSDGMVSTAVQKKQGNALTGFRCAR
jgi:hypothetical protein